MKHTFQASLPASPPLRPLDIHHAVTFMCLAYGDLALTILVASYDWLAYPDYFPLDPLYLTALCPGFLRAAIARQRELSCTCGTSVNYSKYDSSPRCPRIQQRPPHT
ncbi:hypothetical protein PAXRUDRAFT_832180, partial [Paxillus rubicundulus Ve08.2h10]